MHSVIVMTSCCTLSVVPLQAVLCLLLQPLWHLVASLPACLMKDVRNPMPSFRWRITRRLKQRRLHDNNDTTSRQQPQRRRLFTTTTTRLHDSNHNDDDVSTATSTRRLHDNYDDVTTTTRDDATTTLIDINPHNDDDNRVRSRRRRQRQQQFCDHHVTTNCDAPFGYSSSIIVEETHSFSAGDDTGGDPPVAHNLDAEIR
jgi:hypothetical protein